MKRFFALVAISIVSAIADKENVPTVIDIWPNDKLEAIIGNYSLEEIDYDYEKFLALELRESIIKRMKELSTLIALTSMFLDSKNCLSIIKASISATAKFKEGKTVKDLIGKFCEIDVSCIELITNNVIKKMDEGNSVAYGKIYDTEVPMRDIIESFPLIYDYTCASIPVN